MPSPQKKTGSPVVSTERTGRDSRGDIQIPQPAGQDSASS